MWDLKILLITMKKKYDVIFVGRLSKEKGLKTVLETAEYCFKKKSDFKMAIIGAGVLEKWLKKEIKVRKLNKNVLFIGYKTNPREYMSQAKVLILPSYNEGLPLVILEAYSEKVPVIVTPYEGVDEVVLDNRTGLIVERKFFAKEVFNLITFFKKLNLMSQYAYLFARKNFSSKNNKDFLDIVLS